jgi:hypothetical protein
MAYCQEKFEDIVTGATRIVYWQQNKHVHNAALQTVIATWLGPNWRPRNNSYQSNLSKTTIGAIEYR